jgi:hypothetical protein
VPKVLDFGIAKLNEPGGRTLTATGTTLGTPFYMSPEQYLGEKDIDARTDVYAFGALLYEAITGRMPHAASSLPELALKVTTVDAPPLKSLCPEVPSSLARLVDWSLARRREDRVPNLKLLQDELELFARDQSFRGEMTSAHASIPCLAMPANTAETLPETQLGVRLHDLIGADATPPPTAKTREKRREGRRSDWLAWSLLALTLAGSAVLHGQKLEPEAHTIHAAAATLAQVTEGSAMATVAAASRVEASVCADAAVAQDPQIEASAVSANTPDAKTVAPQRSAAAKPKTHALSKPTPSPSAQAAAQAEDSKRSISKILAF